MPNACILFLTIGVVCLIYRYLKYRRFNELLRKLPSPPGQFILGHLSKLRKLNDLMETITNYLEEFDGTVLLRLGPTVTYFAVADHKLIEYLCTSKKVIKPPAYRFFLKWLGMGLFVGEGEIWKRHRNLVTPAFHSQVLEKFVNTFNTVTDVFIKKLSENVNQDVDIFHYVNLCSLDIIAETAMGVPLNAQVGACASYVRSLHEMLDVITKRSFTPSYTYDWLYRLSKDYYKEEEALKILKGYTNSVIKKKQQDLTCDCVRATATESNKRLALLDLLLEKRDELTNEVISNTVEGLMFAGHDTVAIAMAATFYLLAKHPNIQQKTFEEIKNLYDSNTNSEISYEDLHKMKYLEMVIKESLRLYPSVGFIGKKLTEDYEFNGLVLPKGLPILIMIHSIHRSEKYFPNPKKFDPERFSEERLNNILPFSYLPFAAGPRNCVGKKFAMLEMKVVICKVLRNFKILPSKDFEIKLVPHVVQKPKNGVFVKLISR